MADFYSIEEAIAQIKKDSQEVVLKEAYKLQQKGRIYILEKIYKAYSDPTYYDRTGEFLNSIQVKVEPTNDGFEVLIYIADDIMHSQSNWKDGALTVAPTHIAMHPEMPESHDKTLAEVAKYFAEGWGYGEERFGKRLDVMLEISKYVDSGEALKDIISMLKSEGYDIN